jgi:hypothetical protein
MLGFSRIGWYVTLVAVFLAFMVVSLASPGTAKAQGAKAQSIHVLSIDSDDADEQAEALTAALRAKVRETPGWTLLETTQSLSMLTAAFQCPQRPDNSCLQRIGDKLKSDQLIWGVMSKAPGHQVTVDVHLWSRGKPEQVSRESFSDNMKESNDDSMKRLAGQIFAKLLGLAGGTVVLHASAESGSVLVDGQPKATLEHGRATLSLSAGPHSLEVRATGYSNARREVNVQPSTSTEVEVVLEAEAPPPGAEGPSKPLPIRKIVGWGAIGAGTVLIVVGAVLGANYLGDKSDLNSARGASGVTPNYGEGKGTPSIADPCNPSASGGTTNDLTVKGCNALNSAKSAEIGEITTFAIGGVLAATGVYLLLTDHPSSDAPPPAKTGLASVRVLPSLAPGNGSLLVLGRF